MDKLSSKHFMFLILGVSTISITTYSSIFIKTGGRDTWIYAIAGCIIISLVYLFMLKRAIFFQNMSIHDLFTHTCGKFIGSLFLLIFAFGAFLLSIESVASNAMNIHINLFIETPNWFTLFVLLVPSIYLLTRRFNTILILSIISVTFLTIGNIILSLLIQRYCDYTNILPIMKTGFSFETLIMILGSLSCITLTLPFTSNLNHEHGIIKRSTYSLIISSIIIVVSFIAVISTFGPYRAGNIYFPEFIASQRAQVAGFIEFGEFFYIYKSITGWLLKFVLSYFCIYMIFKHWIKNRFKFACLYTILVYICSLAITHNTLSFFKILTIFNYVNIIPMFLIPLFVYSFSYFRKQMY
ncbi:MAG: GerAB/ArcD/ProY family transporter [Clostridium sp.]